MADSTTFPFALIRYTASTDTEVSLANAEALGLQYGLDETFPAGITNFKVGITQRKTDVPNIGQRSTAKQDTGLTSFPISFDIVFNSKVTDVYKSIAKLLYFSAEPQIVRGVYKEGRFGLRINSLSSLFNIVPTNIYGIKFIDISWQDLIENGGLSIANVNLEVVGTYSALVTAWKAI